MSEGKAKGKMEYGLIFAEVVSGLFLLGLLAANGGWRQDKMFFAYVALFTMGTAALWVIAQSSISSKSYTAIYFALYGLLALLATMVTWRGAWMVLLPAGFYLAVALILAGNLIRPWPLALEGCLGSILAWLAIGALACHSLQPTEFGRVKLLGLGFFFVTQAAVSAVYIAGPAGKEWSARMSMAAGLAGVLAFVWMAASFNGLAPEGGSRVRTTETQQQELQATEEALAWRARQ